MKVNDYTDIRPINGWTVSLDMTEKEDGSRDWSASVLTPGKGWVSLFIWINRPIEVGFDDIFEMVSQMLAPPPAA